MCTTAAPAFAASSAELAISTGVTGTAGFFDGVSKEPVSAQVMTVFRDMFSPLPTRFPAIPPPALRILRIKHDPEKWLPVFRKRSCSNKEIERDDDSTRSHRALAES